jgi:hypothetical protein
MRFSFLRVTCSSTPAGWQCLAYRLCSCCVRLFLRSPLLRHTHFVAPSQAPRNCCVRFVAGVTVGSRNTCYRTARYGLTRAGLSPAGLHLLGAVRNVVGIALTLRSGRIPKKAPREIPGGAGPTAKIRPGRKRVILRRPFADSTEPAGAGLAGGVGRPGPMAPANPRPVSESGMRRCPRGCSEFGITRQSVMYIAEVFVAGT